MPGEFPIEIVYPSGSHGSFLTYALNLLCGVKALYKNDLVYDKVVFLERQYFTNNHAQSSADLRRINIIVDKESYLKYIVLCLSRTSGNNFALNEFHNNTFIKLESHSVFKNFIKPLILISNGQKGDVDIQFLREWARLVFFANNSKTIDQILSYSLVDQADYVFNFEWFYQPDIFINSCYHIVEKFNLAPRNNITYLLDRFYSQNTYKYVDLYPKIIVNAIKNKMFIEIKDTNFFQEAWIDNWLVENYDVDPRLDNSYFPNTRDIIEYYKL